MSFLFAFSIASAFVQGGKNEYSQADDRFAALIKNWGYDFSERGGLQKGDLRITCNRAYSTTPGPKNINRIQLVKAFPIPTNVDDESMTLAISKMDPDHGWKTRVHLARSLTIKTQLEISRTNLEATHIQLDMAWKTIQKLKHWLTNPPIARRTKLPAVAVEDQVVTALDREDVGFLIQHWGWVYHQNFGASSPVWLQPATINGTTIMFEGPMPVAGSLFVEDPDDHFDIAAEFDTPKGIPSDRLLAELQRQKPWAKIRLAGIPGKAWATETVDLSGGIRILSVKSQILEFARIAGKGTP